MIKTLLKMFVYEFVSYIMAKPLNSIAMNFVNIANKNNIFCSIFRTNYFHQVI